MIALRVAALTLVALALVALAVAACGASAPTASSPAPFTAAPPGATADASPVDAGAEVLAPAFAGFDASPPDAGAPSRLAETEDAGPGAESAAGVSACNEQGPQDFLVRSNFRKVGWKGLERAIQYRTDTYGYFDGFGHAGPGARPPSASVVTTTFMGLPVRMHRRVVPALACVEQEIRSACADHPYTPRALAGIRFRNTYRGGEVTNHIYGIAIDIDPAQNSCCGCVKPWNEAPACKRPAKTEYDRMAMPECWVHAFERYGFYWLGHDVLRDTMHFEFLGDPEAIVKHTQAAQSPR
jgi:D-alanyl-D-alanine carboxypeptidase